MLFFLLPTHTYTLLQPFCLFFLFWSLFLLSRLSYCTCPPQRLNNTPFPRAGSLPTCPFITHAPGFIVLKTVTSLIIPDLLFLPLLPTQRSLLLLSYTLVVALLIPHVTQRLVVQSASPSRKEEHFYTAAVPAYRPSVSEFCANRSSVVDCNTRTPPLSHHSTTRPPARIHWSFSFDYPSADSPCTRYRRQWSAQLSMWHQSRLLALSMPNRPTFLARQIFSLP